MNEQIAAQKLQQKEDARARSQQNVPRTSSASVSNSQVTKRPPAIYQVGHINVPKDMHGMTRLLHSELEKVARAQSVIITMWGQHQEAQGEIAELKEKVRDQREVIGKIITTFTNEVAGLERGLERVGGMVGSVLTILGVDRDAISDHERRLRDLEGG